MPDDIPASWEPLKDDNGDPVILSEIQGSAIWHAYEVWRQVVTKERPQQIKDDPTYFERYVNQYKSCLLGRLLYEGKPPLPVPPPTHYAAPWYELIENGITGLTDYTQLFPMMYGPSQQEDGSVVVNICSCIWTVVQEEAGPEYIITHGRNGNWRLRSCREGELLITGYVGQAKPDGSGWTKEPLYGNWVLERIEDDA